GDLREPFLERGRRVGEGEDGPGHQLGGLELVVQKAVEDLSATRRRAQRLGAGRLRPGLGDLQEARSTRPRESERRAWIIEIERNFRPEFEIEVVALDVGARPSL